MAPAYALVGLASLCAMPGPLRIGIDARAACEVAAGRGRVVRELLRALAARQDPHRYLCYARRRWPEPLDERFAWRLIGAHDPAWHLAVAWHAARECDVFLATNSYLSPILNPTATVAIVYDLVTFDRALAPRLRSMVIERLTLGAAVRRARGLVCISRATAEQLTARFPAAAARAVVAPLGVSPALGAPSVQEDASLPSPGFVLAVGTLEPRKNLPRLVEAYRRLGPALQAAHPLVVVGAQGWSTGPTMAALCSLGSRAILLGHVSDSVLAELYRRCAVFCYPSLAEGFGLPVLEAMAAGAAVLTSNVSSLPEVGGDAVAYADPREVSSIARALAELLTDDVRRAQLSRCGRARARAFTWQATAEVVLAELCAAA
jgi:glycosyltransferase involved in cell wall biosynthesis